MAEKPVMENKDEAEFSQRPPTQGERESTNVEQEARNHGIDPGAWQGKKGEE